MAVVGQSLPFSFAGLLVASAIANIPSASRWATLQGVAPNTSVRIRACGEPVCASSRRACASTASGDIAGVTSSASKARAQSG